MSDTDRLPPHSPEAERGVLACILLDHVMPDIAGDAFYELKHRTIFQCMAEMERDGVSIDLITLVQRLRDNGTLQDAGGFEYVSLLPDAVPSAANLPDYLDILNAKRGLRKLIQTCTRVSEQAFECNGESAEFLERARLDIEAVCKGESVGALELYRHRFNPAINPPEVRAIYTLAGTPIATPGNIQSITSAIKTGKSATVGAAVASTMVIHHDTDTFTFKSRNDDEKALVWIDSEQAPDDFWHCVYRALVRAGRSLEQCPKWLHAYALTGLGHKQGWRLTKEIIDAAAQEHGGLHSILLDGGADFVADVNDPSESNDRVAEMQGLAIKYDCPLIGVIHFNPGTEKSRGHFGSQFERKAESNLSLEKDANGVTTIFSVKQRRSPIPKATGPRFAWSDEAGMHVSVHSQQSAAEDEKMDALTRLADDVFLERPSMRHTDLVSTVKTLLKCSLSTAERKVRDMSRARLVKNSVAGLYTRST